MDDTSDPTVPPDSRINPTAALTYWSSIPPTINGMLGGYPQISTVDLRGSSLFLSKLRRLSPKSSPTTLHRGVDCGAGIGRVTLGFLSKVCEVVDVVEPLDKFAMEVREGDTFEGLRKEGKIGQVFVQSLEDWEPRGGYELMWNQWCLGYLTDERLVAYLQRCKGVLAEGGWIVVKENMNTHPEGEDVFDEADSSVTRQV
ncbi:MAG: Alpha N-terminal protein methyltransferase 1 [Candelina mexicana]|nr:MAG: Alpha N-terminal protein methyltransferase 1 [Candelina mexicana]